MTTARSRPSEDLKRYNLFAKLTYDVTSATSRSASSSRPTARAGSARARSRRATSCAHRRSSAPRIRPRAA